MNKRGSSKHQILRELSHIQSPRREANERLAFNAGRKLNSWVKRKTNLLDLLPAEVKFFNRHFQLKPASNPNVLAH